MEQDKKKEPDFVPPDGGFAWVIVAATTLINITVLPLVQCFGIIYQQDFKAMGITSAETSFLLHLHSAIYCSLGLLGSPLLKRYSFRQMAFLGTCLMTTGIFLSSFASSYCVLIFTFSILLGVGQGVMLPATYLAANTYFKKRLTLAVSFTVTGASISNIIMPPLINKLLSFYQSTQLTVLTLAAVSTIAIAASLLLKPIKKTETKDVEQTLTKDNSNSKEPTEELEMLTVNEQVYKETTLPTEKKNVLTKISNLFNLELLKERAYVVAIIGMSISFASELNIIIMMSFILPELSQFEREDVAFALSVQSIADIIGRVGIPIVAHNFSVSPRIMYAISLITSTIGRTVMALFYSSKGTIYGCVCLIGLAKGIKAVYQSVIIPKYVSLDKLPAANGLNMMMTGTISIALGPIIGAIHDVSGSYVYTLHTASILSMFCVMMWSIHYFAYEKGAQESKESS